ncbi:MAG: menaquinone biosynthesis protein [Bacteroidales bacterium]
MAITVSLIEYANTIPFEFGIQNNSFLREHSSFVSHYPAEAAQHMKDGMVDVSIMPVAAIPEVPGAQIISPFCIAAKGSVDSVLLCSHKPLSQISSILLDYQSRTSNLLVQILAYKLWDIRPRFISGKYSTFLQEQEHDARVIIGDRALDALENKSYPYMYDLAQAWYDLYALPFVFACWVSNTRLPDSYLSEFNNSLQHGITHIDEAITTTNKAYSFDLYNYLHCKIMYTLSYSVQDILDIFYADARNLPHIVV